ncbi:MAG: hypothetical protein COA38_11640 [Fluviicola sp.]|nr:MAG: hypothetical protein COA38_11640 [Fluviicola sp.]
MNNSLEDIYTGSKRVNILLKEIAAASSEQLDGIQNVSTSIKELELVTQNNASNAQELASTAVETADQVQNVRSLVLQHTLGPTDANTTASGEPSSDRILAATPAPLPVAAAAPAPVPSLSMEDHEFPMDSF